MAAPRINISFSEQDCQDIPQVMCIADYNSMADAVRGCVFFTMCILRSQEDGFGELLIEDENGVAGPVQIKTLLYGHRNRKSRSE